MRKDRIIIYDVDIERGVKARGWIERLKKMKRGTKKHNIKLYTINDISPLSRY